MAHQKWESRVPADWACDHRGHRASHPNTRRSSSNAPTFIVTIAAAREYTQGSSGEPEDGSPGSWRRRLVVRSGPHVPQGVLVRPHCLTTCCRVSSNVSSCRKSILTVWVVAMFASRSKSVPPTNRRVSAEIDTPGFNPAFWGLFDSTDLNECADQRIVDRRTSGMRVGPQHFHPLGRQGERADHETIFGSCPRLHPPLRHVRHRRRIR